MNAKHQWKYTSEENIEEISPVDITFEVPGEVTLTQMLYNFEYYLKAVGFIFDGHLEIVPEEGYDLNDLEDEINEEPPYCCMGDSSSCLDNEWTKADKNLKEMAKHKWVHGFCNPPSK